MHSRGKLALFPEYVLIFPIADTPQASMYTCIAYVVLGEAHNNGGVSHSSGVCIPIAELFSHVLFKHL